MLILHKVAAHACLHCSVSYPSKFFPYKYVYNTCVHRYDIQIKQIENDKDFVRWSTTSDIYSDMKRFAHDKQKAKVLKMISTSARERWFLLKLKAKFAGM